ncbi:MAG: flavin reductase [Gammaproteobacteria bacterium]|nr:flavin reductase [Gammaproteobacteria bacterium]
MSGAPPFDPKEFRKALGSFATGVTIITTRAPDGAPVGLTVNSFNSVSLNPPMVLWSLAETSLSLPAFRAAAHWAVHVLAADQDDLSQRFARRGEDKFAGLELDDGAGGIPLLRGCSARFQCRTAFQYDGGDHVIFVGEVLDFDRAETAPLVFHGGRYAHAAPRAAAEAKPRQPYLAGSFTEDFVGYLLGRSHFQFFRQIRPHLRDEGLDDEEFYVLATLTLKRIMSAQELDAAMAGILDERSAETLHSLAERGLVCQAPVVAEVPGPEYQLTERGRSCALRVISAAKAVESGLLERLGATEATLLKSLLNRLLGAIDPAADTLWGDRAPNEAARR